jgi:nucleotide-binding universal stress UspA family protein
MLPGVSGVHDDGPLTLLVAYDGSADADAAIEVAAARFPGARTRVLSVSEPRILDALGLTWLRRSIARAVPARRQTLDRPAEAARAIACRAAQRARSLGLEAEPRWQAPVRDVARAIVDAAARERADLIVTGRHGLTGHRSSHQGRVAQGVVRHADLPVVVVPSGRSATAQSTEPRRPPVAERAVGNGGLRIQVVPLEDV